MIDFFGIDCRTIRAAQLDSDPATAGQPSAPRYTVLISAAELAATLGAAGEFPAWFTRAASVFVFDFDRSESANRLLQRLTGNSAAAVVHSTSPRVTVAAAPELCGPLSGLSATRAAVDGGRVLARCRDSRGFRSVIADGEGDVLFECLAGNTRVFISANGPSIDIDRTVDGNYFDVRTCFCGVAAAAIFLKHAFADVVFSAPEINACLIVDDPALKTRYGFLDFRHVLAAMNQHEFTTTIAFIPWNWRRTNRRTADMFLSNPERYSLVVHGCDHTSREFGTTSVPALNHKLKAARRRVTGHEQRTGIPVSPIMVFPQGVFSPESAHALKCNNFIAAVNTEVNPFGAAMPRTEVRELWSLAITKYSGFPIFTRRYIEHGLENFAFDAFLGKPCLLVAHHEVFKNHGRDLTAFVQALNQLPGGIRWRSLNNAIKRSWLTRSNGDGVRHVRMFANEMLLENRSSAAQRVVITKHESDPAAIKRVRCGQQEAAANLADGWLRFETEIPAGQSTTVAVEYVDALGESRAADSLKYRFKVFARRHLSEVRDDYVCRNELLNDCATRVLRLLK
jgi:hypothetical protein